MLRWRSWSCGSWQTRMQGNARDGAAAVRWKSLKEIGARNETPADVLYIVLSTVQRYRGRGILSEWREWDAHYYSISYSITVCTPYFCTVLRWRWVARRSAPPAQATQDFSAACGGQLRRRRLCCSRRRGEQAKERGSLSFYDASTTRLCM